MDQINAFLASIAPIFAAGVSTVEQAGAIVDLTKSVIAKGGPDDADNAALDAIIAKETDILNAPLEGELP